MERLRRWWRDVRRAFDENIDAHVRYAFGDLLRAAELADKYERLEKHYPNILARLNAAIDRKERRKGIIDVSL